MKLDKPINGNYCATVVKIKNIVTLENCDNVVSVPIFGFSAIVSKDIKVGDIGIVFPAETQLSDQFCRENNLYRHSEKNKDVNSKGYIEDNRRVRAVKFRGNTSSCFFISLDSLSFVDIDLNLLSEGDEFDVLNGIEICKKYEVPRRNPRYSEKKTENVFKRVESKHLPEHVETSQFFKWGSEIDGERNVIVTQKIHGTSIRIGHTIVKRKFSFFENILEKFGVKILPYEYDYVYGSRKVIKDINNPNQQHYYENDIWTSEGEKLKGLLPENYIIYGELIGWTPEGKEIQKDYTYSIKKDQCELYVYRIAIVNPSGHITDLSWEQLKSFCHSIGVKYVPEIFIGKMKDIDIKSLMDKRYFEDGYKNCLYLGDNKLVDEGVCIRVEGNELTPRIYKAKSPIFFEHETKFLDSGEQDLESAQSYEDNNN